MTDIIRLDAATLAGKIAAKELSSTEVTQAYLDQIAATDQQLRRVPARRRGRGTVCRGRGRQVARRR